MEEAGVITIIIVIGLMLALVLAGNNNDKFNFAVRECQANKGVLALSQKGFLLSEYSCYTLNKEEIERLLSE